MDRLIVALICLHVWWLMPYMLQLKPRLDPRKLMSLICHSICPNHWSDPMSCCHLDSDSLLLFVCCQLCRLCVWTYQGGLFPPQKFQGLVYWIWDAWRAECNVSAFTPQRAKTEMTRQSPFCQHRRGSTAQARIFILKVNGRTPRTKGAGSKEACVCFTLSKGGTHSTQTELNQGQKSSD